MGDVGWISSELWQACESNHPTMRTVVVEGIGVIASVHDEDGHIIATWGA